MSHHGTYKNSIITYILKKAYAYTDNTKTKFKRVEETIGKYIIHN